MRQNYQEKQAKCENTTVKEMKKDTAHTEVTPPSKIGKMSYKNVNVL